MANGHNLYVIAGPNGAGKTAFAREFLLHFVKCPEFVNSDLIAGGLSPFSAAGAAIEAGRIMLRRVSALAAQRRDFAFETTLSGRGYLSLFRSMRRRRKVEEEEARRRVEEEARRRAAEEEARRKAQEAAERRAARAGKWPIDGNTSKVTWVSIPGGTFMMGSTKGKDEQPPHRVTVRGFQLAKTEVTNAQYRACVQAGACTPPGDGCGGEKFWEDSQPVVCVDWDQAKAFSEWAGGTSQTRRNSCAGRTRAFASSWSATSSSSSSPRRPCSPRFPRASRSWACAFGPESFAWILTPAPGSL